jgi:hypothetical protein
MITIMSPVQATVNLVCTQLRHGGDLAAQRWYSDHVQLLLTAPELQQATLYRCTQSLQGQTPDYACIYDFASPEAFEAYEHGQPKAQAGLLTDAAPGRDSLHIVQRTQYARFLNRQWHRPELGGEGCVLLLCLHAAQATALATQRWLADGLHQLHACTALQGAQVYAGLISSDALFLKLDLASPSALQAWEMLQLLLQQGTQATQGFGQAPPSYTVQWVAQMRPLTRWQR